MYGHPDDVRHSVRMPYISLLILTFLKRCILVETSLINTKLGDFVNIGVLFLPMWILTAVKRKSMRNALVPGRRRRKFPAQISLKPLQNCCYAKKKIE